MPDELNEDARLSTETRERERRDLSFLSRDTVKEGPTSLRSIPKSGRELGAELALPSNRKTGSAGHEGMEKGLSGGGAPRAAGAEKAEETAGACFLTLKN